MEAGSPQGTEVIEARSSAGKTYVNMANAIRAIAPKVKVLVLQRVTIRPAQEYEGSMLTGGGMTPPGMHTMVE